MFQQRRKFNFNTSNWKRYHRLNSNNNDKDRHQDIIDSPTERTTKFPCNFKRLSRFKTRSTNIKKTGLSAASSTYSISSVKERLANEAGSNTGIDIYRLKQKMTNTLSVMANVLRNVVSKQRKRYKEKGFNLDLAYITDNIIAMGFPADNFESMYRNPLPDVYKFLEDNHLDHYKIYNLCLERSYDIAKFHGRVAIYPFEDHNPPTIELILKFCEDMDKWLKAHTLNVAAVHCKAGKGRTGTMICCYLVYSGLYQSATDALDCYDEQRTKDRKGVTIPSQRRYVHYFSILISSGLPYERRTLQFCEIRFAKANTLHNLGAVHCSISVLQEKVKQLQMFSIDFRKTNVLDMKNASLSVTGDIKVELTKNTKKIFHFWFNTFFVSGSAVIEGDGAEVKYVYTLQKPEIDDVHKDKSFPDDFKVELVFLVDDNNVDRDPLRAFTSTRVSSVNPPTQKQKEMSLQQDPQPSTSHSLPQTSSGSEINFTSDQKSSSSTSVSSSFGVGGTDTGNVYESNRSITRDVVPTLSNHYMVAKNVNNGVVFPASPAQHMALPPNYMEQHHQQEDQQHKENQKQQPVNSSVLVSMTSQKHFQRKSSDNSDNNVGESANDAHVYRCKNIDVTNINANKSSSINSTNIISNSYNHNHSNNSSKTSSVSSQSSSSAIADNEEDWESANTTITTQNNTQHNEVERTKLYIRTCHNISSVDVIKQNNKLNNISGSGSNVVIKPTIAAAAVQLITTKLYELNNKNMQPRSPQQNLCSDLINNELASTITSEQTYLVNEISTLNTNNTTTANNTSSINTNLIPQTSQQFCHSCLQTGDLCSELKCC